MWSLFIVKLLSGAWPLALNGLLNFNQSNYNLRIYEITFYGLFFIWRSFRGAVAGTSPSLLLY